MRRGAETLTSQVNVSEYVDYFTKFLEQGKDVMHVYLSSGISGTINSARSAAEMAAESSRREKYTSWTLWARPPAGLIMDKLADLRDGGMSIDEAMPGWRNKLRLHHWYFSTDLTFYVKGGRISRQPGTFGGLLNICPLMNMDNLGRLIPRTKIRGKTKVIQEIVKRMEQFADGGLDYSGKCYISQSDCPDDARAVADLIEARFKNSTARSEINYVGTTIGSHTGPGTVALFFWGQKRETDTALRYAPGSCLISRRVI